MATTPNQWNHTLPILKKPRKKRRARRSSWSNYDYSTTTRESPRELEAARGDKRRVVCSDVDKEERIAAVREKLVLDLKSEADKMKNVILKKLEEEEEEEEDMIEKCKPSLPTLRSSSGKTERVKFSVQLSKKEIEDDFMAMLGRKPPLRPKNRPKLVQKHLDTLFPGLSLTEVRTDSYKALEDAEKGKARHPQKKKIRERIFGNDI